MRERWERRGREIREEEIITIGGILKRFSQSGGVDTLFGWAIN